MKRVLAVLAIHDVRVVSMYSILSSALSHFQVHGGVQLFQAVNIVLVAAAYSVGAAIIIT